MQNCQSELVEDFFLYTQFKQSTSILPMSVQAKLSETFIVLIGNK